jgi:exodeoxyribonuclease VII large subunit
LTIRGELMQHILSVSEINRYIRELLSQDPILSHLWVKGEISNYKSHYSGHLYFTIKDEKSLLKCVMFKTHALKLKFEPENGMKVIIKGYVSVFERDGQYQLYVEEMQPDGIGNLHIAFEPSKFGLNLIFFSLPGCPRSLSTKKNTTSI